MKTKYPRTLHLPFSPEVHSDDKVLYDISGFIGKEIVITEKLDGGNCCLKTDGVFARTHALATDCETFNYIKNVHYFSKKYMFNNAYKYYGENVYAIHSIEYTDLKDFFYLFGISDEKEFISYDDMLVEARRLDFLTAPLVFRGVFNSVSELKNFLDREILKESFIGGNREGFVLRNPNSFKVDDFSKNIVKYVREGHVQTDEHWKTNWKPQKLNK